MKRKRAENCQAPAELAPKQPRSVSDQSLLDTRSTVDHPVLRRLYPEVITLRHYLLSQLPASSKNRRRKITLLGTPDATPETGTNAVDVELGSLLDTTLVGVTPKALEARRKGSEEDVLRSKEIESFSQQVDPSSASTFSSGYFLQEGVVDFIIWVLFRRHAASNKPLHLLCNGFQRAIPREQNGAGLRPLPGVPGITEVFPNPYVDTLKGHLWCQLLSLLGYGGDRIMMDLLLYCGIFSQLNRRKGNYFQICGCPVFEIPPIVDKKPDATPAAQALRKPGAITFVRARMFYARAPFNAKGGVLFGLRHIHVLNRYPDLSDHTQTVHIMKYIFPRQFGLHNVFTSRHDSRESAMPFKDYTLREKEIQEATVRFKHQKGATKEQTEKWIAHVPKRLRGEPVALVEKLRKLNQKCPYFELLRHYCPVEGLDLSTKPDWRKNTDPLHIPNRNGNPKLKKSPRPTNQTSFTDLASPPAHVSAFCRAVVAKVIPNGFFGDEDNRRTIIYWIDRFIDMRKFESLTLHQITQKLQISTLAWIRPPGQSPMTKMARTDFEKRQEIFLEFVYWLFDSFLVPLIRSNFHVTESNVHRHRIFYFRHDVWLMLSEPSLKELKMTLFEELPRERATEILMKRTLGFSTVRLVPKTTGVRMITNLRKRQQYTRKGVTMLGRSINSVLAPAHTVIGFEKMLHPDKFGCSLFNTADMFPKLLSFKRKLKERGLEGATLYFVKLDVQSCFDTIPQQRLLAMADTLLSLEEYQTGRHVEISPLGDLQRLDGPNINPAPVKRFVQHIKGTEATASFEKMVREKFAKSKTNTIFVDMSMQQRETRDDLKHQLREHIQNNLVKFGRRFYRQKAGIPQGSVLSSILCNFFYAQLERDILSFLLDEDSLLMRLLDDFLLITLQRSHAERFVKVMHRGSPEYGVIVKKQKSLANFDVETGEGERVPRPVSDCSFPYCGVLIDTRTLEVSKNSDRSGRGTISDSLTVDLSKVPGQTFHRKALNGFKIQLQAMLIDTSLNSVSTVLANLYNSFQECAVRCFEYVRVLSKTRTTHPRLLIKTIDSVVALTAERFRQRTRNKASQNAERVRRTVTKRQIQWIACKAFEAVFRQRQTQHRELVAWLGKTLAAVSPKSSGERSLLESAIRGHPG